MLHNLWIDPNGKIYHIKPGGHATWAFRRLNRLMDSRKVQEIAPTAENIGSREAFERLGWLRVMDWSHMDHPKLITACSPSELQAKAIHDYCMEFGIEITGFCCDLKI